MDRHRSLAEASFPTAATGMERTAEAADLVVAHDAHARSPAIHSAAATPRGPTLHALLLVVHRYVGLTIATFLVVASLTGSVLVFFHELDGVFNPHGRVTPPTPTAAPLDPFVLREHLVATYPEHPEFANSVVFAHVPGHAQERYVTGADGVERQAFIDPYTGSLLGSRTFGDLSEGLINLMPFIYHLHDRLALGTVGAWLLGIVALLWTLDCFVGFYLTLPQRAARPGAAAVNRSGWWARWKPAWLIKGGSLFGGIFTFHRASGLWVWPLLFIFAWSSVGMNMWGVFKPVMSVFGTAGEPEETLPAVADSERRATPSLAWRDAYAHGQRLMAAEAERRGFTVVREGYLDYEADHGVFRYDVHSTHDVDRLYHGTRVWFDASDGSQRGFHAPSGIALGDTLISWSWALHMGRVGGWAYRLTVFVVGFVITALCVTGVWIWWRKVQQRRRARDRRADKQSTAGASA